MRNRRGLFLSLMTGFVALTFVAASVLADELIGVISKVNADAKKITVIEKDSDKEIEVTINDETEVVTKKKSAKVDLEKLEKKVAKAKDNGQKGVAAKITHERGVASKITYERKKKTAE